MNRTIKFTTRAKQAGEKSRKILTNERKALDLTLKDVSTKFDAYESTLKRIEDGDSRLSIEMFIDMCDNYGLDPVKVLAACLNEKKGKST